MSHHQAQQARATTDLCSLLPASSTSTTTTTRLPSSDAVLALLAQRYKHDLASTFVGSTTLVALNPNQVTQDVGERRRQEYEDHALALGQPDRDLLQPHAYELAGRAFLLMTRTGETQSAVFSGIAGSGTNYQQSLFLSQLVHLSTSPTSKRDARLAAQIHALELLLSSFGSTSTRLAPNAPQHSLFLELHFSKDPLGFKLAGAKALPFGLDARRIANRPTDERAFDVFYQLLAGATDEERRELALRDSPEEYTLLEGAKGFVNPNGPATDDGLNCTTLRSAFTTLGFKPRHVSSIFRLLSSILLLGNLTFLSPPPTRAAVSSPASVEDRSLLSTIADLLGVHPNDLERGLTNKTMWKRKEMTSTILHAEQAAKQRDELVAGLYAILFAFVVETANHKLFPGDDEVAEMQKNGGSSIVMLSTPGFESRSTGEGLVRVRNGFSEFKRNFIDEVVGAWRNELSFDGDNGVVARAQEDGVRVRDVIPSTGTGAGRLDLLRGGRVGGRSDKKPGGMLGGLAKTVSGVRKGSVVVGEEADELLVQGMRANFARSPAFVGGGSEGKREFAVNHFVGGVVEYDARGFVEADMDPLDAEFVALFRGSGDGFIAKLFSGPSLATQTHPLDPNVIVAAQVSAQPLRRPSPVVSSSSFPPLAADHDPTQTLLDTTEINTLTSQLNATLSLLLNLVERTHIWNVIALLPNEAAVPRAVDTKRIKAQISGFLLPELLARKQGEFVVDVEIERFAERFGLDDGSPEAVQRFLEGVEEGVKEVGTERVWLGWEAWKAVEDGLRKREMETRGIGAPLARVESEGMEPRSSVSEAGVMLGSAPGSASRSTFAGTLGGGGAEWDAGESQEDLLLNNAANHPASSPYSPALYANNPFSSTPSFYGTNTGFLQQHHQHPSMQFASGVPAPYIGPSGMQSDVWGSDKEGAGEFGRFGPSVGDRSAKEGVIDKDGKPQEAKAMVEELPTSRGRRVWVAIVWMLTWWIPDVCLKYLGRMKRPDVRLAWREKVALCMLIGFFCGIVIFYIVFFGNVLCPNKNKAWDSKEVSEHTGTNDYYASVRGVVYDLTKFYKIQHSDITGESVDSTDMLELAGEDLTDYFPIPLTTACPTLVTDATLSLQFLNFTATITTAVHTSGSQQVETGSVLHESDWYYSTFLPAMEKYKKGPLVWSRKKVKTEAESAGRLWAIYKEQILDLTDYFNTIDLESTNTAYEFLNSSLANLWQAQPGTDITQAIADLNLDDDTFNTNMDCIKTLFYNGEVDFRLSARCQVQPDLLLAFTCIIAASILAKFLAALQLGSRKTPELRDKFVICQVPCYTEGEESLKKTIDSLANLHYDDKRKLLLIICDGMIVGSGNDRPTPRIVLDILGVDQDSDPDPLPFKSISEGSKQLNYGKVWSGLYEVDGHVVPYIVVAKVGRPTERSRPGNRGKRDSQILAMRFLNRVHFDAEMYPLELEMYHQIKNVIGVDPQLYEYMLVIDADTSVAPDSLNRLVSCAADDSRIIGICGETRLDNEQASWWTMIQVYEYFISHHMAKAFESLFGSVTCLPGCFTMYRLRSADKGKPLLISSLVIDEYSECNLDTLHKKNLLALGEDRYLTTLILKHFPTFKTKFTADAQAMTVAPDTWSILLSQRRRWINSTVHNLAELMFLPNMCGFCCFGMRFIVILDLVGTLILPATFCYLVYLIVEVSIGDAAIPIISLALLGATYGLQAIIFLLRRQWQFIGWLVIYLLAYPIYSFLLPVYSFWCFDDFTWGNTRVVVGEGKSKKVLSNEDEAFDEASIPKKKFADYQQALLDDDGTHTQSIKSGAPSIAGFSMATKLPPGSYQGGGDYYRDTVQSRSASRATFNQLPGLPSMPSFGFGGPGSIHAVSEFGYPNPPFAQGNTRQSHQSMGSLGGNSTVGGPPPAPRRESTMSGFEGDTAHNRAASRATLNSLPGLSSMPSFGFGGPGSIHAMSEFGYPNPPFAQGNTRQSHQSLGSLGGGSTMGGGATPTARPGSTMSGFGPGFLPTTPSVYSMNPFMSPSPTSVSLNLGPNPTPHPTDEELVTVLRLYLVSQDLMTVTKRTAREGLATYFPNADLSSRKDFLNRSIDQILGGGV